MPYYLASLVFGGLIILIRIVKSPSYIFWLGCIYSILIIISCNPSQKLILSLSSCVFCIKGHLFICIVPLDTIYIFFCLFLRVSSSCTFYVPLFNIIIISLSKKRKKKTKIFVDLYLESIFRDFAHVKWYISNVNIKIFSFGIRLASPAVQR